MKRNLIDTEVIGKNFVCERTLDNALHCKIKRTTLDAMLIEEEMLKNVYGQNRHS